MARNIAFIPEEKVEKALEVFWEKGYVGTSLSDLTQIMGLNKSSLYNSFGSKYELFMEVMKAYALITERDYESAIEKGNTAIEKLDGIVDKIVELSTVRKNSCLGIMTTFELASGDKQVRSFLEAAQNKTIHLIESLIIEAQNVGEIDATRDPAAMSRFMYNTFPGFRQSFIVHKDVNVVEEMASELKLYLRA